MAYPVFGVSIFLMIILTSDFSDGSRITMWVRVGINGADNIFYSRILFGSFMKQEVITRYVRLSIDTGSLIIPRPVPPRPVPEVSQIEKIAGAKSKHFIIHMSRIFR